MRAKIQVIKTDTPHSLAHAYHEAKTANDILIVFSRVQDGGFSLDDTVEIDLEILDAEQSVRNLTTGKTIALTISKNNVHDLHIPMRHGGSRFPSKERRAGN